MNVLQSYTYAPNQVDIIISGYRVVGWNTVEINYDKPTFRPIRGIRGKNTRVREKNLSAEVKITIPQTSPANTVFNSIAKGDFDYGTGMIFITVKDRSSGEIFQSAQAYLDGFSPVVYDNTISDRLWTVKCMGVSVSAGGDPIRRVIDSITGGLF